MRFTLGYSSDRTGRGFTLTELLVSIGVFGLLIGILLPALLRSRDAARGTVCLANLRGAVQTFDNYRHENGDEHPFAPPGTWFMTDLDGGLVHPGRHWDLAIRWGAVVKKTAPWPAHFGSWVCPGSGRKAEAPWLPQEPFGGMGNGVPSYSYSNSFVARPALWDGRTEAEESFYEPTRGSDVRHPSAKALLFDWEMAHLTRTKSSDRRPVAFADGHAAMHALSESTPPVPNPLKAGLAERLHDTRAGVLGRDY